MPCQWQCHESLRGENPGPWRRSTLTIRRRPSDLRLPVDGRPAAAARASCRGYWHAGGHGRGAVAAAAAGRIPAQRLTGRQGKGPRAWPRPGGGGRTTRTESDSVGGDSARTRSPGAASDTCRSAATAVPPAATAALTRSAREPWLSTHPPAAGIVARRARES